MNITPIDKVLVLGSGVLGGQIAWQVAFKEKHAVVYDINEQALDNCKKAYETYGDLFRKEFGLSEVDIEFMLKRIRFTTDLKSAVEGVDLVVEAVPEKPEIKNSVYTELSGYLDEHTLIATNTSTLLPSQFADVTGRPEKFCTLHFAATPWQLNLAEIMAHDTTSRDTIASITQFAIEIGMVPIPLKKEQHGYLLNTWLVSLLNSAQTLVTNGIGTAEDVDRTYMIFNKGSGMGPFGIMDVVGMTTAYNILNHWADIYDDKQMRKNADYLKEHFIDKGHYGVQSGQGYYRYPKPAYLMENFTAVPDMRMVNYFVDVIQPLKA
ncbi:MAG: 3-hydroxyacyl-CoA dehydrogenase [Vibrio sp.]